jgi:hypothetical protein
MIPFDDHTITMLRTRFGPAEKGGRTRAASNRSASMTTPSRAGVGPSAAHRIGFVAALAERLMCHYQSLNKATGKGRPDLVRNVLTAVGEHEKGGFCLANG